jgi:putative transposase
VADYWRNFVPGGSYFFTVNLADRRSRLLTDKIALLRSAFRFVARRHPFTTEAVVVLPEHLHCIWTLPSGDAHFANRWRLIKTEFSMQAGTGERRSPSRMAKGERGIWQRRFWEHTLRDENDFACHCDYIHFNPVKHGHVSRAGDWPYSSFQRFVQLGVYPLDWGGDGVNDGEGYMSADLGMMGIASLHPSYGRSRIKPCGGWRCFKPIPTELVSAGLVQASRQDLEGGFRGAPVKGPSILRASANSQKFLAKLSFSTNGRVDNFPGARLAGGKAWGLE